MLSFQCSKSWTLCCNLWSHACLLSIVLLLTCPKLSDLHALGGLHFQVLSSQSVQLWLQVSQTGEGTLQGVAKAIIRGRQIR